ncbi:MAG: portal protein, partial [Nocardioides sp.]|nr:portal protein [Nocardioides sp.]
MSEAPAFLQLQNLSDEEESLRTRLISQLRVAQRANKRQESYYEGARLVRDLGIAIPPHLRDVESVIAWP